MRGYLPRVRTERLERHARLISDTGAAASRDGWFRRSARFGLPPCPAPAAAAQKAPAAADAAQAAIIYALAWSGEVHFVCQDAQEGVSLFPPYYQSMVVGSATGPESPFRPDVAGSAPTQPRYG